tara:strand:+ start:1742 stop:1861 length:120 start_codon:yes stop_codon:yes gene_type:complete
MYAISDIIDNVKKRSIKVSKVCMNFEFVNLNQKIQWQKI